jgi:DNA-binding MarR family transcriptional regulator
MDDLQDKVLVALRRIIRANSLYSRRLGRDTGLSTPQLVVIRCVADRGTPTVTEIARHVSLSQATVTTILNRLEAKGLVRRVRSTADKRRVNINLTDPGRELLVAAPQPLQDSFTDRFSALDDWEQHMIVAALERVATMMDAADLDAAPLLVPGEELA